MVLVDAVQAARVGEALRPALERYRPDSFTDPRFYPPAGEDPETVARYFLVMVAIDHRLSRPGRPYEAVVRGERLHGADLLYRLGRLRLDEDPGFFSPRRLAGITARDVEEWLCVGGVCPPDPGVRAALLRDLGSKLEALYGGSALRLLEESRGLLHSWDPSSPGLVERLRVFEAYGDPVEKKPMLLAKFLERRGLLEIRDPWDKRVPVDNHVARIALRLGLVRPEPRLLEKIRGGRETTPWEDVLIRIAVREAWHLVAERISVDDFILDDVLWTMGRRVCVHGRPRCRGCSGHPACEGGGCILRGVCPVGLGVEEPVEEHRFLNTWWY
ncbi:hypothetical protein CF15_04945 [Pyrodictium occultum]|uniref:Iron-sulfur cluster loop n=1 Tax=Pyrodictium occultum TaxID=2309 RepID=A0A0V8RVN4_PYROC|nr:hypothetical protein [Pyrodictium occultum]KSW12118.1 hypothetical protein CF15_04945 [Pyrodictium occultum]